MRLVGLPAALPQIMAGVRLSIAVSLLLLTVVSELILPTDGLGTYWVGAQARIDVAAVIAGLLVVSDRKSVV